MHNLKGKSAARDAEAVAVEALAYLAADPTQLQRFLALTGLSPGEVRAAAREAGFLAGVLDFVLGHEPTLLSFAASAGLRPEDVERARSQLAGSYSETPH